MNRSLLLFLATGTILLSSAHATADICWKAPRAASYSVSNQDVYCPYPASVCLDQVIGRVIPAPEDPKGDVVLQAELTLRFDGITWDYAEPYLWAKPADEYVNGKSTREAFGTWVREVTWQEDGELRREKRRYSKDGRLTEFRGGDGSRQLRLDEYIYVHKYADFSDFQGGTRVAFYFDNFLYDLGVPAEATWSGKTLEELNPKLLVLCDIAHPIEVHHTNEEDSYVKLGPMQFGEAIEYTRIIP